MRHLVLGGVRSGKSQYAQSCIAKIQPSVVYVATSQAWDDEMQARIQLHQDNRPNHWQLVEEPLYLAQALQQYNQVGQAVIVECLTLWLSNLLCQEDEALFSQQRAALLALLADFQGDLVLVSSEVGQGIMPMNALARRFADEAGLLNQAIAAMCERVTLVCAGLPMELKR